MPNLPHPDSPIAKFRSITPLPNPIVGRLNPAAKTDPTVLAVYAEARKNKRTDEQTAQALHAKGYVTSTGRVLTGSNVGQFRLKVLKERKNREHKKPNYEHQSHIVHTNLRTRGLQEATQKAKYAVTGPRRKGVMLAQNVLGRDKEITEDGIQALQERIKASSSV